MVGIKTVTKMEAYMILGDDPQKEYRRLAVIHHPDKGGNVDDFNRIREAYEALTKEDLTAEHELLAQLFLQELDFDKVCACLNKMEELCNITINSIPEKALRLKQARSKARGFLISVLESAILELNEERRTAQTSISEIKKARTLLNNLYT